MLKLLGRLARELNWSRRRWSTASDREFHEQLYRSDDYDPFSPAYAGNLTIRRFADLVEPHLPASGTVVDLGCGPGEITCELAARRHDLSFVGIDHSSAAIAKAQANIARRGVANVRFGCQNVEEYTPPAPVELATLFDSFHHLLRPAAFVQRLTPHVKRWALIEPRGSWFGSWQKDLDFDWVAHDLDKIRARIESAVSAQLPAVSSQLPASSHQPPASSHQPSAAVERRYTFDDLQSFFDGYALDMKGTVAGLETYPPSSRSDGVLNARVADLQYRLYRDIDDWLRSHDLDLHAKHWLIVADREGKQRSIDLGSLRAAPSNGVVAGPYDVKYGQYRGPHEAAAGERIFGSVTLINEGWQRWSSTEPDRVMTSYHWLDANGRVVIFDGERTPLPRTIGPGETCDVAFRATAPSAAGRYRLAIDLVSEGVTWFSQAGRPWLEVTFLIKQA